MQQRSILRRQESSFASLPGLRVAEPVCLVGLSELAMSWAGADILDRISKIETGLIKPIQITGFGSH